MKSRIASCVTGLLFAAAIGMIAAQPTPLAAQSTGRIMFPKSAHQTAPRAAAPTAAWSGSTQTIPRAAAATAVKPAAQVENWRTTQEPPTFEDSATEAISSAPVQLSTTSAATGEDEQQETVGPALYVQDPSQPLTGTVGADIVEEGPAVSSASPGDEDTPSDEDTDDATTQPMATPDPNAIQRDRGAIQQTGLNSFPKGSEPAPAGQAPSARPGDPPPKEQRDSRSPQAAVCRKRPADA